MRSPFMTFAASFRRCIRVRAPTQRGQADETLTSLNDMRV